MSDKRDRFFGGGLCTTVSNFVSVMSLPDPPALGVLELDVEESLLPDPPEEPPSKRIRGIRVGGGSEVAPSEGPDTIADSFAWAQQFFLTMGIISEMVIGVNLAMRLQSVLAAGLRMITDYSGTGCPEEAVRLILVALGGDMLHGGLVRFLRAGDVSAICRGTLLAHLGPLSPHCVFGDILSRVPNKCFGQSKPYPRSASWQ